MERAGPSLHHLFKFLDIAFWNTERAGIVFLLALASICFVADALFCI
jgi:hypothetical protein